uniref:Uncharacterized protein n=1 Tax=Oryza glumipatula TaxID=40148 RepID=A0A0D9ZNN1_9ORYZ
MHSNGETRSSSLALPHSLAARYFWSGVLAVASRFFLSNFFFCWVCMMDHGGKMGVPVSGSGQRGDRSDTDGEGGYLPRRLVVPPPRALSLPRPLDEEKGSIADHTVQYITDFRLPTGGDKRSIGSVGHQQISDEVTP